MKLWDNICYCIVDCILLLWQQYTAMVSDILLNKWSVRQSMLYVLWQLRTDRPNRLLENPSASSTKTRYTLFVALREQWWKHCLFCKKKKITNMTKTQLHMTRLHQQFFMKINFIRLSFTIAKNLLWVCPKTALLVELLRGTTDLHCEG